MPIGVYEHKNHKGMFQKGCIPWTTGRKHSEETKQKMREKARGAGNSQYGKKHSEEHKRKISDAVKGKKHPMFGKKHTEQARNKIKEARAKQIISIGRKMSEIARKKLFTIEFRKKIGERFKREKNPKWKGGITPLNHQIRTSFEYKIWRKSVFERDNYTCVWCEIKSGNGKAVKLNVHHIKSFSKHPELRFDVSNGITLCEACHKKTDNYGRCPTLKLVRPLNDKSY